MSKTNTLQVALLHDRGQQAEPSRAGKVVDRMTAFDRSSRSDPNSLHMVGWQHTSYIEDGEPERVADALVSLFCREGMQQVAGLSSGMLQHGRAMDNTTWAVAVLSGAAGWTIVKTLPLELLGEQAPTSHRMRLVDLAGSLGVSAVQVNLYETAFLVLVEVDRQSRYLLSGYGPGSIRNPDPLRFNEEQLAEDRIDVRFELLPLQQLVWESTRYECAGPTLDNEQLVARLACALGGRNAASCDDKWAVDFLLGRKPLPAASSGIALHFKRQSN
jgi:hypothetical protein